MDALGQVQFAFGAQTMIINMNIQTTLSVFLAMTLLLSSEANVLKQSSNKFAFPPHLIGTNGSTSDGLEIYINKYHPVDLGVDNYDDEAPMHVRQALANATISDNSSVNQYSDDAGLPRLRRAITDMYSPLIGHQLNPDDNVLVTLGATGAVYSTIVGHTVEGDEWLIIQPSYTIYEPIIRQARGVPRFTSLKLKKHDGTVNGEHWEINKEEFESQLNGKTKGIVLNNPVNPIGKVLTYEELQFIGRMAEKYNLLILSDEPHEWVTYKPHIRIASLPGLYERTITIGSSSKAFSLAGWRIGWAFGPSNLLNHAKTVNHRTVSQAAVPQQEAIAFGFEEEIRNFGLPYSYFESHRKHVQWMRDFLTEAFVDAGMNPIVADGGHCIYVDWSPLRESFPELRRSLDFSIWMIENVGVLGYPGSAFYGNGHQGLGDDYARFCYHKKEETLRDAASRLMKLRQYLV